MSLNSPRVSIGLPIYNGDRYLTACLESLLQQTFTDFEIIISDNASMDTTGEICREFARRDSRIRYYRNETNVGPVPNYNRVFDLATGDYFRWMAHDDVCAPEWLERCVTVLDSHPEVALCYTKMCVIDDSGQVIDHYSYDIGSQHPNTPRRFRNLICVDHRRHSAIEIFGLMRRDVLLRMPHQGLYARADSVFLARVALFGQFYEVPEFLFFNRDHGDRSSRVASISIRSSTQVAKWIGVGPLPPTEWFNPAKMGQLTFPEWNLAGEYWKSIALPDLNGQDRALCYIYWAYWLVRNVPKLLRDVLIALELIIRRLGRSTPTQVGPA
ncbi:glycosyltransferase family 2 protein [Alkalinema pantanalense CENA528]|uniref:glycosyltransferase family 2 protein n=1 Tax=Alkalinema pantanalense TaxID=1620705 RepID=UPI003D6F7A03